MSLCASCSRVCARLIGPVLGALLFAVPMVATGAAAQGMRQSAPQMQRGPAAPRIQRQPAAPQAGQQRGLAQGQTANATQFRTALQPYGRWQHHARWGDVWSPANRVRNWRPYTVGRWAYTDDWGWYWISGTAEASWGWVTYHYGRWVFDPDLGWIWVPGTEWSPGWVQWRHGEQYVGWAPLPPDEIVVEYRDQPDVWLFVRESDFVFAPSLAAVILPVAQFPVFLRETAVVNTAVFVGGGFAVNPGISPAFLASAIGRPVPTYSVRPRVLAGTAQVPGAMQVRSQDLRSAALRTPVTAQRTQNVIRPSANAPRPQPLAAGERGRLGSNPPRMARGGAPTTTTGQASKQQQQAQPQQMRQQQPSAQQPRQPQGAQRQPSAQPQSRAVQAPAQQREQQRRSREESQRRAAEQRQQQMQERRAARPSLQPSTEGRSAQPQRQPQAERRAIERQRPATPAEHRGAPQQARPQRAQPAPHATEGRGAGPSAAHQAAPPRPQPSAPGATVGRGGGPAQAAPQHGPVGGGGPPGGGHGGPPGGPHH